MKVMISKHNEKTIRTVAEALGKSYDEIVDEYKNVAIFTTINIKKRVSATITATLLHRKEEAEEKATALLLKRKVEAVKRFNKLKETDKNAKMEEIETIDIPTLLSSVTLTEEEVSEIETQVFDQVVEEVILKSGVDTYVFMDAAELNKKIGDRYFRHAFCFCEKEGVRVDIEKAKQIHINTIRKKRNFLLEESDKELMIALSKEDTKKINDIKNNKQILRDIPNTIDLSKAKSLEQIRSINPIQ